MHYHAIYIWASHDIPISSEPRTSPPVAPPPPPVAPRAPRAALGARGPRSRCSSRATRGSPDAAGAVDPDPDGAVETVYGPNTS